MARLLAGIPGQAPPTDAQLRRAVSTAYYALFHKILRAAATRFMGAGAQASAGYALIYRSFDHARMKAVCQALNVSSLKDSLKFSLGTNAVSRDMRDFAGTFPTLQNARHLADYHPDFRFGRSHVLSLIDAAEAAMAAFDRTASAEQADILALLMAGARP